MPQLTPEELAHLLAAVPLPVQQRAQPVRVNLRPGLPADYAGPVELADLRAQVSPWHWLDTELAVTPHSQALAAQVAAAGVGTVLDASALLAEATDFQHPADQSYWGYWGALDLDDGDSAFMHPAVRLINVMGFIEQDWPVMEEVTVLQVYWTGTTPNKPGPLAVFGNVPSRESLANRSSPWFWSARGLRLRDPATGEVADLAANELPEDEADLVKGAPAAWQGNCVRYPVGATPPAWLRGGLQYDKGRLVRADSGQELTLGLRSANPNE